jgi:hypothetical protein
VGRMLVIPLGLSLASRLLASPSAAGCGWS